MYPQWVGPQLVPVGTGGTCDLLSALRMSRHRHNASECSRRSDMPVLLLVLLLLLLLLACCSQFSAAASALRRGPPG